MANIKTKFLGDVPYVNKIGEGHIIAIKDGRVVQSSADGNIHGTNYISEKGKGWYRIAESIATNEGMNFILSISTRYQNNEPDSAIILVSVSPHNKDIKANRLVQSFGQVGASFFSKIRLVSTGWNEKYYVDVYYNSENDNTILYSLSSSVNVKMIEGHKVSSSGGEETIIDL